MTTNMPSQTPNSAALLYLASPALPIGAFAYSQGLEQAIELGWVTNADDLYGWTKGVLQYGLCETDIPVLAKIRASLEAKDEERFIYWNDFVLANRETHELYAEDINLGKSLLRLMKTQGLLKGTHTNISKELSFVSAYALASESLGISVPDAAMALAWSWLENQITVSCKVIPIGQSDGQKVLLKHLPTLPELVEKAIQKKDDEIGSSLPGMTMASALHETQYSRLFRS